MQEMRFAIVVTGVSGSVRDLGRDRQRAGRHAQRCGCDWPVAQIAWRIKNENTRRAWGRCLGRTEWASRSSRRLLRTGRRLEPPSVRIEDAVTPDSHPLEATLQ